MKVSVDELRRPATSTREQVSIAPWKSVASSYHGTELGISTPRDNRLAMRCNWKCVDVTDGKRKERSMTSTKVKKSWSRSLKWLRQGCRFPTSRLFLHKPSNKDLKDRFELTLGQSWCLNHRDYHRKLFIHNQVDKNSLFLLKFGGVSIATVSHLQTKNPHHPAILSEPSSNFDEHDLCNKAI
jgi:hypothetical protein